MGGNRNNDSVGNVMQHQSVMLSLIRAVMHLLDAPRLHRQGNPKYDAQFIQEVCIDAHSRLRIDIVYATNASTSTPTCIMIHGGGLFYGNKALNIHASVEMAKRGFNVVNIDYPLLDHVNTWQQVQVILDILWWMECNATYHKLNVTHVYMMGDSAGALLSLVTAIVMNTTHLRQLFNYHGSITLRALGLLCIVARLQRYDSLFFIQHYALKHVHNAAFTALLRNPIHSLRAAPPCFIMGSEQDYLANDTKALIVACKALNHPNTVCFFPKNKQRPLRHVFPIAFPTLPQSQHVFDACTQWFNDHHN